VEDDEGVRNFVSTALKDLGYTVIEAINGKKALEILTQNGTKIDLIVTDLIMPEMNGKEMAVEVEKILPEVRILFTSGYAEDHIVQSGSLDKGVDFLQKPYSIQTLAKKVREVLDKN
jgi:CheY-like chemotaxis protein